jgi:RNA polymerase sigma factor (sigma-70 family)
VEDLLPWSDLFAQLEQDLNRRAERLGDPPEHAAWNETSRRLHTLASVVLSNATLPPGIDFSDIAQEVLKRLQSPALLQRLRRLNSPVAYLGTVIRNIAADARRKHLSRERAAAGWKASLEEREEADPDAVLFAWELLERLSPEERALATMRFWEDLDLQTIADRLGISYSAAAVRVSRLLTKLRRRLASR